mmetsp:Transcript_10336/g.15539  ORF Transcript_10336/g.15539 Transcript_10336/m.15539 type:complete len:504 (-) Transcript_10336:508-2019(-)
MMQLNNHRRGAAKTATTTTTTKMMSRSLHLKHTSPLLMLLLLVLVSTLCLSAVNGEQQEQVCSEDDHTCHAKEFDPTETIPFVDDDDDDYEDYEKDHDMDDDDDYVVTQGEEEEIYDDDDDTYEEDEDEDEDDDVFDDDECSDRHPKCLEWAEKGECKANPGYMLAECQFSCSVCTENGSKYGKRQNLNPNNNNYDQLVEVLEKMEKYMTEEIIDNPKLNYLSARCKNRHKECAFWSIVGECDANPAYMLTNCAPVCNTCHLLDFSVRCPTDPNAVDAWEAGDLNKMFERIVDGEDSDKYNASVLSRPSYPPGTDEENADFQIGPWVVTVDDFLTDIECDTMIELGGVEGYARSEDVGKELFDGSFDSVQSSSRTSHNAWCTGPCYEDPIAKDVMAKIEKITGIPEPNSENLQLLRYHEGQFYRTHHDFIDNQEKFPAGPRLLTAFLYLNDVEEGGGTNFPRLGITVNPKRGRLLLWPSVLDSDPTKKRWKDTSSGITSRKRN